MESEDEKSVEAIRIVTIDYYLAKPVQGLDPCYSELQSCLIKTVPVIRVFGSNKDGAKICVHVHGVFPHVYIPFQDASCSDLNSYILTLASSLDKAINISLGGGSRQHVFRVSLVKGTSFYGYHKSEEKFLRIHLYNPGLVRRVANLLLGGAVMGRSFQPHESHIPYVLQFLIDHNLYGMSQLFVPSELLLYRTQEGLESLKKVTSTALEVDILSVHILNRLLLTQQTSSGYGNPGISTIWEDERIRRDFESISQLEPPPSQVRLYENATESDRFYRDMLKHRVAQQTQSEEEVSQKSSNTETDLDGTIVNEELVASLTQKPHDLTLEAEDLEMLAVMKELEEDTGVELDSTLAPLTQAELPKVSQGKEDETNELSDEELDFTIVVDEQPSETQNSDLYFDQLDGVTDSPTSKRVTRSSKKKPEMKDLAWISSKETSQFKKCNVILKPLEPEEQEAGSSVPEHSSEPIEAVAGPSKVSLIPKRENPGPSSSLLHEAVAGPSRMSLNPVAGPSVEPVAGPSRVSLKPNKEIPGPFLPPKPADPVAGPSRERLSPKREIPGTFSSPDSAGPSRVSLSPSDEDLEDTMIHSFYDKTLIFDDFYSDHSEEDLFDLDMKTQEPQNEGPIVIEPHKSAPSFQEVLDSLHHFGIPEQEPKVPIYSDFSDVTKKKEVGREGHYKLESLQIGSSSLLGLSEFESCVNEGKPALTRIRERAIEGLVSNVSKINVNQYLTDEEAIVITPAFKPPTAREARIWLQARKCVQEDEESPIRQKREVPIHAPPVEDENPSPKKQHLAPKFDFNVTSASPSSLEMEDSPNDLTKETAGPSPLFSYVARRKMRLSLSRRKSLRRSRLLAESPAPKSDSEKSGPGASSQESNNSISNSTVNRYLDERSRGKLNLNNTLDLSCSLLENTQSFHRELENLKSVNAKCEHTYLTIMNVDLHVSTRGDLLPDPAQDPVEAVFYRIINDIPQSELQQHTVGIIVQGLSDLQRNVFRRSGFQADILVVEDERQLFQSFLELVGKWDPDILSGYEIERASWGYLIERGAVLELDMLSLLSRVLPSGKEGNVHVAPVDEDMGAGGDREYEIDIQIRGRILLNVWRLLRHEIALTSYSFENICFHILHHRHPLYSHRVLTEMWRGPKVWIAVENSLFRVEKTLEILSTLDLIGRTCELAKLFGIQFFEVLSRGSQFRVESMMMRLTKPRNYVSVSPSVNQRAVMKAPEYLPLILEPQSKLYSDPVIVLDFQSLYPSVIIAYNYCFSTCLGRVHHLGTKSEFEFGATTLKIPPEVLKKIVEEENFTVSPCGAAFVTPEVRKGVLPQMLKEILDTRLMVKQSMKVHKENKVLQRVLHSRQLGLKLIANVTYGYTAANFSGRMPCVEVGDSVVSKGRETLERAIKMVEENQSWRVKVVYGDTDSLFVLVPGRDRATAFKIGQEIADAVTNANPTPVKLKLEKVYQPCILQTKKRYVGYMYETPDQKEPVYEAKGIETVRRDGCPAVQKLLEKTLRVLFETFDVSAVKKYINRQLTKVLNDEMSLQDLIFAKEFRGIKGYKPTACVPALELTRKWIQKDPRAVPLSGERVPFVVANGPPGLPLIRLVRSPYELLTDKGLKINSTYYIEKVIIPPLNRCLLLIGADVREWYEKLPRKMQLNRADANPEAVPSCSYKKSTIAQYFTTASCLVDCGRQASKGGLCLECRQKPQQAVIGLSLLAHRLERSLRDIESVCQSCCGRVTDTSCISLDCPVLYRLNKVRHEATQVEVFRKIVEEF